MNGYELLVPYVVAERQARVEAERLARLAQRQAKAPVNGGELDRDTNEPAPEPWVPVLLRGYPYEAEYGR